MGHFIQSLQLSESTEFDLELGDNVDNSIIDVRKLEVFAQNLSADMILVNTVDGKMFIFGVMKARETGEAQ